VAVGKAKLAGARFATAGHERPPVPYRARTSCARGPETIGGHAWLEYGLCPGATDDHGLGVGPVHLAPGGQRRSVVRRGRSTYRATGPKKTKTNRATGGPGRSPVLWPTRRS